MLHTRKPQTEEMTSAMQARNARRVEIAKRKLGEKYAHHPANHVRRLDASKASASPLFNVVECKHMPSGLALLMSKALNPARDAMARFGFAHFQ